MAETVAAIAAAKVGPSPKDILAEVAELEAEGRRRAAIGIVARRHADPADARAVLNLERNIRRWRQNETDACPNPEAETG
jgi:hypothetical protein